MNPFLTDEEITVVLASGAGNLIRLIGPGAGPRSRGPRRQLRDEATGTARRYGSVAESLLAVRDFLPQGHERHGMVDGRPVEGILAVVGGGLRGKSPVVVAAWCAGDDPTIHLHACSAEGLLKQRAASYLMADLVRGLSSREH